MGHSLGYFSVVHADLKTKPKIESGPDASQMAPEPSGLHGSSPHEPRIVVAINTWQLA